MLAFSPARHVRWKKLYVSLVLERHHNLGSLLVERLHGRWQRIEHSSENVWNCSLPVPFILIHIYPWTCSFIFQCEYLVCVWDFPNFTSCLWSHRGFRIGICCSFTSYQWSPGHLFKGGPGAKDDQLQVGLGKQLWPSSKILVSVFFFLRSIKWTSMNGNVYQYTNSRCQNPYKPAIVGRVTHTRHPGVLWEESGR